MSHAELVKTISAASTADDHRSLTILRGEEHDVAEMLRAQASQHIKASSILLNRELTSFAPQSRLAEYPLDLQLDSLQLAATEAIEVVQAKAFIFLFVI